jgi:hypothetical protein
MYSILLDNLSYEFLDIIYSVENVTELTTTDYGWSNYRFKSDTFRMAHVERYSDSKIEVLHVTIFPHHWSPEPIFGFDIIVTDSQPVGAYMDLSPVIKTYPFDEGMEWHERKKLPEWATVFSDRFVLIKPKDTEEFYKFSSWVIKKFKWYLNEVLKSKEIADYKKVIEMQNRYCDVQCSNPRTYNVLKTKLGEESAKYFMENILFPKIKFYNK